MRLTIRLLLVWLLALALPLQGLAAASLRHCAPAGDAVHGSVAAHEHGPGQTQPMAHDHAAMAAAEGTAVAATVAADAAQPSSVQAAFSAAKCSACAACCAALGLPAGTVKVPPAAGTAVVLRPVPTALASFVPAGLDRPPRLPRA